ncbi:phosphatase, partial [Salmonella enterica subsp. enterica serovar Bareilly str. CFSAN001089]
HRKAWRGGLGRYGLRFDEQAMVALNGSPTRLIAQSIIELNHADVDALSLAREQTDAVNGVRADCGRTRPWAEGGTVGGGGG